MSTIFSNSIFLNQWIAIALALVVGVHVILHFLIEKKVPEPYMDEIFHIPQGQRYCDKYSFGSINNNESEISNNNESNELSASTTSQKLTFFYDDKITTPPGMYLAPAFLSSLSSSSFFSMLKEKDFTPCSVGFLRGFNNKYFGIISFILTVLILQALHSRGGNLKKSKNNNDSNKIQDQTVSPDLRLLALRALRAHLFPFHFFYFCLFYTEPASNVLILAMCYLHLKKFYISSAFCGFLSLFARQNNIVWVFGAAVFALWDEVVFDDRYRNKNNDDYSGESISNTEQILDHDNILSAKNFDSSTGPEDISPVKRTSSVNSEDFNNSNNNNNNENIDKSDQNANELRERNTKSKKSEQKNTITENTEKPAPFFVKEDKSNISLQTATINSSRSAQQFVSDILTFSFTKLPMHIFCGGSFIYWVVIRNNGSVTLGHQEFHGFSLHGAMFAYFGLFLNLLGFAFALPAVGKLFKSAFDVLLKRSKNENSNNSDNRLGLSELPTAVPEQLKAFLI